MFEYPYYASRHPISKIFFQFSLVDLSFWLIIKQTLNKYFAFSFMHSIIPDNCYVGDGWTSRG